MRVPSRVLLWAMLVAALLGCTGEPPAPADTASDTARAPAVATAEALPPWMAKHAVGWAQRPWEKAEVGAVWLLRHGGQDAVLVDAPRGHRDTLMRTDGTVICEPAGFGNDGNGRCPSVMDAGTTPRLVWVHPGNPASNFGPPPAEASPLAARPSPPPGPPLPAWLEAKIAAWERQDAGYTEAYHVDSLQHKGATAYLVYSGCCDQFNTLYGADGRELCSPSGGHTGDGDGRCPTPEDPGTQRIRVWTHPGIPEG